MLKNILILMVLSTLSLAQAKWERPPQFILISFDGSKSHNFWRETLSLANDVDGQFSYFISGVYFLKKQDRTNYLPPQKRPGASDIGFADNSDEDLLKRTDYIWQALSAKKPMDIGSHVNGHFNGQLWTYEDWTQEFKEFHKLVERIFSLYPQLQSTYQNNWAQSLRESLKGFRAPLLAQNSATQQVLKDFNYSYDASQMLKNTWPYPMNSGVWNLGLSRIKFLGTKKDTVAMDYNILYGQCNGQFNPKDSGECSTLSPELLKYFEAQTYYSYVNAFLNSYYGNRSPISIGHHFSLWNKGIYWKALQKFILNVCTQPEVKCITHKAMIDWLNLKVSKHGTQFTRDMNQGLFNKSDTPLAPKENLKINFDSFSKVSLGDGFILPEISSSTEKMMLKGDLPQAHQSEDNDVDLTKYKIIRNHN